MDKRLEVPPGKKAQGGPERFKKGPHKVSVLSFNPTFTLEFHNAPKPAVYSYVSVFL